MCKAVFQPISGLRLSHGALEEYPWEDPRGFEQHQLRPRGDLCWGTTYVGLKLRAIPHPASNRVWHHSSASRLEQSGVRNILLIGGGTGPLRVRHSSVHHNLKRSRERRCSGRRHTPVLVWHYGSASRPERSRARVFLSRGRLYIWARKALQRRSSK